MSTSTRPRVRRSHRIDPRTLNELDRRILKEALRLGGRVQRRLALDFQL